MHKAMHAQQTRFAGGQSGPATSGECLVTHAPHAQRSASHIPVAASATDTKQDGQTGNLGWGGSFYFAVCFTAASRARRRWLSLAAARPWNVLVELTLVAHLTCCCCQRRWPASRWTSTTVTLPRRSSRTWGWVSFDVFPSPQKLRGSEPYTKTHVLAATSSLGRARRCASCFASSRARTHPRASKFIRPSIAALGWGRDDQVVDERVRRVRASSRIPAIPILGCIFPFWTQHE